MGNKSRFHVDIMAMHPETTGSCILCIVKLPSKETIRFIVDCGLFQEKEYVEYNKELLFDPHNIDFVIVTHNHVDHIGRVPLLFNKGYNGKIYCSSTTEIICPVALWDTSRILREVAKRNHTTPLYTDNDVESATSHLYGIAYREECQVHENVTVTMLENGHLIGSSLVLVKLHYPGEEDINLLFTGDYKGENLFFDVYDIPEEIRNLKLTIITEATYGYMSSEEIRYEFKDKISKGVSEEKTIILPVFSLGRSQEILYTIRALQEEGIIPSDYGVFFDGKLAQKYTGIYLNVDGIIKQEMQDFLPHDLIYVNSESRADVLNDLNKKIIITTSGMATYGPAQVYLPKFLPNPNTLVLFTGYMAEGTLGRSLMESQEGDFVKVGGLIVKRKAEVSFTNEFSAHAKADEIVELLKKFYHINAILVNHGESNSKEQLAKKIVTEVDTRDVGILGREYFFRVNAYGVIKTLGTRFP